MVVSADGSYGGDVDPRYQESFWKDVCGEGNYHWDANKEEYQADSVTDNFAACILGAWGVVTAPGAIVKDRFSDFFGDIANKLNDKRYKFLYNQTNGTYDFGADFSGDLYNAHKDRFTALQGYYLVQPRMSLDFFLDFIAFSNIDDKLNVISALKDGNQFVFIAKEDFYTGACHPQSLIAYTYSNKYNIYGFCPDVDRNCTVYTQTGSNTVYVSSTPPKRYFIYCKTCGSSSTIDSPSANFNFPSINQVYSSNPFKVFYSRGDAIRYVQGLSTGSGQQAYINNTFYNYTPTNITYASNTNYVNINNNNYNTIVGEANTVIDNSGSISPGDLDNIVNDATGDLQDAIEEGNQTLVNQYVILTKIYNVLTDILSTINKLDTGDTINNTKITLEGLNASFDIHIRSLIDSIDLNINKLLDAIQLGDLNISTFLSDNSDLIKNLIDLIAPISDYTKGILDVLTSSLGDYVPFSYEELEELLVRVLSDLQIGADFTETNSLLEDIIKRLDKIIKDGLFVEGGESGESIFEKLLDLILNALGTAAGNLLAKLFELFIGDGSLTDVVLDSASALAGSAQSKFPTSLPWDIVAIINCFSAQPETPRFEIPFEIERLGISHTIVIDFEKAESLSQLSRSFFIVIFLMYLLIQTRNIYGSVNSA